MKLTRIRPRVKSYRHSLRKITEAEDREFRCWSALRVTTPTAPDFAEICQLYGLTPEEVIAAEKEGFMGFTDTYRAKT